MSLRRLVACLGLLFAAWSGVAAQDVSPGAAAASASLPPLVYVGDRDFPPYEYLDDQGQPAGFNVAVAREIARTLDRPLVVRLAPWAEAYGRLASGDGDMGTLGHSPERANRFRMVAKIWTLNQIVAFKPGRDAYPKSIDEMGSESIGVERASLVAELLAALPQGRRPMLVETTSQRAALRLLDEGRVTGVSGNELTLRFAGHALDMPELERVRITSVPYMLSLSQRAAALEPEVRAALERMEESGVMDRLREEYLTVAPDLHWPYLRGALATAALFVVVLVAGIVLWNAQLRTKVTRRTTQLQQSMRDLEDSVRARDAAIAALASSEGRYRSMIGNMLGGLITVDALGRIDLANPAAERLFGYEPGELKGLPLTTLVPADSEDEARARLRAAFKQAIGRVTEWEGRRKDGSTFPFELALFSFEGPSGVHYAGNLVDISERRQIDRMKNEFVSVVSHELRTPLTAIRASMQLLQADALSAESRQLLDVALSNTDRLIRIVNDMLDIAKIEAGRLIIRRQPCHAAVLIDQAVNGVAPLAASHRITLRRADVGELPVVEVDPDRVVQMLVNLLSNAVKFAPAESDVTIAADSAGRYLRIRVHDHGRGIPEEQMARLFQKFNQLDSSDSRRVTGTGLGLAITKAIAEQHGGTVAVSSRPGDGTTFTIELPLTGEPATGTDPTTVVAPDLVTTGTGSLSPPHRTS